MHRLTTTAPTEMRAGSKTFQVSFVSLILFSFFRINKKGESVDNINTLKMATLDRIQELFVR